MKKNNLLTGLSCLLFIGCWETYDRTIKVCDEKLYAEKFRAGTGLDTEYLTDSLNFRLCVGKRDDEHENFTYECKVDSVFIEKVDASERTFRILERRAYCLKDLRKKKDFK